MSEQVPPGDPPAPPAGNRAAGSWAAIIIVIVVVVSLQLLVASPDEDDEATRLAMISLQAKMLIGMDFLPSMVRGAGQGQLEEAVDESLEEIVGFASGPSTARAVAAVYAFVRGQEGLERARMLVEDFPPPGPDPGEAALHEAVLRALGAGSLEAEDRARISEGMGWFGEVLIAARAPADDPLREELARDALRPLMATGLLILLAIAGLLVGVLLLVIGGILLGSGKLELRMKPQPGGGAIYVQAFAVYLSLWLLLQVGPALLGITSATVGFAGLLVASAAGVLWPLWRGVPAEKAARDLGFHRGNGWLREIGAGVTGYLAILPIVALGLLMTMVLMVIADVLGLVGEETALVSHPVLIWMSEGSSAARFGILLLAAVFAPFFEEAMFRGALLRGMLSRFGPVASGLLVAFVFAVIHPQGLLALPALMSLAFGFALLREWRDSLIAPMVGHAINNGVIVGFMWLALG